MNKRPLILKLFLIVALFFVIDYGLGEHVPMEVATVTHKTFVAPSETGDSYRHILVVVQPGDRKGYWIGVSRQEYYDISVGDKLPMSKDYGLITGWEYNQEVTIYNEDGSPTRAEIN